MSYRQTRSDFSRVQKRAKLKVNKSVLATSVLGVYWIIYFFLSEYAPNRNHVYSRHAFGLMFLLVIYYVFKHFACRLPLKLKANLDLLLIYIYCLPFMIISSVILYGKYESTLVVGSLNNIVYQLIFVAVVLLYVSYEDIELKRLVRQVAILILTFALFSSLIAYQLFFTGGALFGIFYFEDNSWPQLYGFFQSPNFFINAVALGIFSGIFLYNDFESSALMKLLSAFSIFFLSVTALLSGSKGGILFIVFALLSSSFLVLITNIKRETLRSMSKYFFVVLFFALFAYVVLWVYLFYLDLSAEWFFRSVMRVQSAGDGTGRLALWRNSLEIISQANLFQLLFGHGNDYIISEYGMSTHNDHLKIVVEYGLIAYVALSFLVAFTVVVILKKAAVVGREIAFFSLVILIYCWGRPSLNSGLFSAGLLGFLVLFILILARYDVKEKF